MGARGRKEEDIMWFVDVFLVNRPRFGRFTGKTRRSSKMEFR